VCYDSEGCALYVGALSHEVYAIDLEAGQWRTPIQLQQLQEVNALAANPTLPVISCAGDGLVESYDLRDTARPLQSLRVVREGEKASGDVSCCAYSSSGMQFVAGTSSGLVRVFDVRSSNVLVERDHLSGYAVRTVTFHTRSVNDGGPVVCSADQKTVKIFDASTGSLEASIEHTSSINQLEMVPESGLFFLANDAEKIGIYFVPSLGIAPTWCSFLDNITEQLEENKQQSVFDDYQFVTREQLAELGGTDLVGTKFVQPYMHGFFMNAKLHQRLKDAVDPFAYQDYRRKQLKEKVEAKRKMRTASATVSVNKNLREKLQQKLEKGKDANKHRHKEAAEKAQQLLSDDRFKELFVDPDFAIEEKVGANEAENVIASIKKRKRKP
jgi:ribosome biogenesis protein ENP2